MRTMDVVNERWKHRNKSNLVMWFMRESKSTYVELADALGISVAYFHNKLNRNSFSFEDILSIANYCGYSLYASKGAYGEDGVIIPFDKKGEIE